MKTAIEFFREANEKRQKQKIIPSLSNNAIVATHPVGLGQFRDVGQFILCDGKDK